MSMLKIPVSKAYTKHPQRVKWISGARLTITVGRSICSFARLTITQRADGTPTEGRGNCAGQCKAVCNKDFSERVAELFAAELYPVPATPAKKIIQNLHRAFQGGDTAVHHLVVVVRSFARASVRCPLVRSFVRPRVRCPLVRPRVRPSFRPPVRSPARGSARPQVCSSVSSFVRCPPPSLSDMQDKY